MDKKILGGIAGGVAVVIIAILVTGFSGPQTEVTKQTNEKIGLVINTPNIPTTLDELNHSYEQAASSGIGRSNVYVFWNSIEPEREQYNFKETDLLMSFNKKHDQKVTLFFSLVNGKTLGPFPSWIGKPSLQSVSDDKVVSVLDAILSRYDIIDTVIIAGETDEHFRYNEETIPVYKDLFNRVYEKLKEKHPNVKIGNAFSLNGVLNKQLSHIVTELNVGDFVAFSYLPVDTLNDIVKTPELAQEDLEKMIELVPDKKIALFEISWSTSEFVGGNEGNQTQFIENTFDFYKENESKIEFLTWYRLYDRPQGSCEINPQQVESKISVGGGGGMGSSEFVALRLGEYVCSAGLLDKNDNPKLGWNKFNEKIKSLT